MKKSAVMLLVAALVFSLFVSCSNDVTDNGLVHVVFHGPAMATKDVAVTLDPYTFQDLYWNYIAVKADSGTATHAVTTQTAINKDGSGNSLKGTDNNKLVGPFDVGSWTFTFYGYATKEAAEAMVGKTATQTETEQAAKTAKVLYQGSTTVSLTTGHTTPVLVTASHQGMGDTTPNTTWGKGTLNVNQVYISEEVNNVLGVSDPGTALMDVTLTCLSVTTPGSYVVTRSDIAKDGNNKYSVTINNKEDNGQHNGINEGVYLMDLTFAHDGITTASVQNIVVIILNGKTTTVSGDIRQLNSDKFNLEVAIDKYVVYDNYYIVVLTDAEKAPGSVVPAAVYETAKTACIAMSTKAGNETKEYFVVEADGTQHKFVNGVEQPIAP